MHVLSQFLHITNFLSAYFLCFAVVKLKFKNSWKFLLRGRRLDYHLKSDFPRNPKSIIVWHMAKIVSAMPSGMPINETTLFSATHHNHLYKRHLHIKIVPKLH